MFLRDALVVLGLVALLSFGGLLFPPMCLGDYQRWMHTIDVSLGNPPDTTTTSTVMLYSKIPLPALSNETSTICYPRGRRTENGSTSGIDVALQEQISHGYPLHPVSEVLPKRVFVVYGLESSGTTFTAKTIALALGLDNENIQGDFVEMNGNRDHVQHISLPFGDIREWDWGYNTRFSEPLPMIPVIYPKPCQMNPIQNLATRGQGPTLQSPPQVCRDFMDAQVLTRPHRFFVNMTTHITWYRERGIMVYPIMMVRDPGLHMMGITDTRKGHTQNDPAAYGQYEMGRAIMVETIEKGLNPIILSYETMLTLQRPYICQLYETLGIETSFIPTFKNGNTKYLEQWNGMKWSFDPVEFSLMREDDSPP